jgi:hypothetical protein
MLPSGTSSSKSWREDLPKKGNEIFKIFRTRRGQICAHRRRPSSHQPLRSLFPDYTPQRLGSSRAFLSSVSAAENAQLPGESTDPTRPRSFPPPFPFKKHSYISGLTADAFPLPTILPTFVGLLALTLPASRLPPKLALPHSENGAGGGDWSLLRHDVWQAVFAGL